MRRDVSDFSRNGTARDGGANIDSQIDSRVRARRSALTYFPLRTPPRVPSPAFNRNVPRVLTSFCKQSNALHVNFLQNINFQGKKYFHVSIKCSAGVFCRAHSNSMIFWTARIKDKDKKMTRKIFTIEMTKLYRS